MPMFVIVTDMAGRPLHGVEIKFSGTNNVGKDISFECRTINGSCCIPEEVMRGILEVGWTSPLYNVTIRRTVLIERMCCPPSIHIVLPIGNVKVIVYDGRGRGLQGANVRLGDMNLGYMGEVTDSKGRATFKQVLLESEGKGITYPLEVYYNGRKVFEDVETFSSMKRRVAITTEVFDIKIYVCGARGQPLRSADIILKKDGAIIIHTTTDRKGHAQLKLIAEPFGVYELEAIYRGFTRTIKISMPSSQEIEVRLPIYKEYFGIPISPGTGAIIEISKYIVPVLLTWLGALLTKL